MRRGAFHENIPYCEEPKLHFALPVAALAADDRMRRGSRAHHGIVLLLEEMHTLFYKTYVLYYIAITKCAS